MEHPTSRSERLTRDARARVRVDRAGCDWVVHARYVRAIGGDWPPAVAGARLDESLGDLGGLDGEHGRVMHEDQVDIRAEQVAALVADQIPALAGKAVVPINGAGTVNAIFRIGDDVATRFPLRRDDADRLRTRLERELSAASEFRRACDVPTPEPLHLGRPGHDYPLPWTAQTWLSGATAAPTLWEHSMRLAQDLAELLEHLSRWDIGDRRFRGSGRGGVLSDHDKWAEECIRRSEGLLDTSVMRRMWNSFRQLPREDPDVLCHTDLTPSNVLVADERIVGLLDTGRSQPADPALDLVGAWHLLADAPRERLRRDLGCSDLRWERGKAWAFQQAAGAYWYYVHTNPDMAEMGRTTLSRLAANA